MLEGGQAPGLGAELWLRMKHRNAVCSSCWSLCWVWLVSCCLFSLLNLFLSEAEGIKDAIWDCLFRYSMVLTSFSLFLLFLVYCQLQRAGMHMYRCSRCPGSALPRELGRHKLEYVRGKASRGGARSGHHIPRYQRRAEITLFWTMKENVWDFIDTSSGSNNSRVRTPLNLEMD